MHQIYFCKIHVRNGLFPLPNSDSDSDSATDSCTMQDFSIGSDSDSDPLIEMYVIGMKICPQNGYSNHLVKGSKSEPESESLR